MTSTIARRTARYARAEFTRNQYVSASTMGIAISATMPSRTSMSEVSREMIRPDV